MARRRVTSAAQKAAAKRNLVKARYVLNGRGDYTETAAGGGSRAAALNIRIKNTKVASMIKGSKNKVANKRRMAR
jgi:hypothetical protein